MWLVSEERIFVRAWYLFVGRLHLFLWSTHVYMVFSFYLYQYLLREKTVALTVVGLKFLILVLILSMFVPCVVIASVPFLFWFFHSISFGYHKSYKSWSSNFDLRQFPRRHNPPCPSEFSAWYATSFLCYHRYSVVWCPSSLLALPPFSRISLWFEQWLKMIWWTPPCWKIFNTLTNR